MGCHAEVESHGRPATARYIEQWLHAARHSHTNHCCDLSHKIGPTNNAYHTSSTACRETGTGAMPPPPRLCVGKRKHAAHRCAAGCRPTLRKLDNHHGGRACATLAGQERERECGPSNNLRRRALTRRLITAYIFVGILHTHTRAMLQERVKEECVAQCVLPVQAHSNQAKSLAFEDESSPHSKNDVM